MDVDDGSRGPVRFLISAVSGFLPSYARYWTDAFWQHPIEFALIGGTIALSLMFSNVLQGRIHDRARLSWHRNLRSDYAQWLNETQKAWRNGMLLALGISLACLIAAYVTQAKPLLKVELGVIFVFLLAVFGLSGISTREVRKSEKAAIPRTWALSVARFLRTNPVLQGLHKLMSGWLIPLGFAALLVAGGGYVIYWGLSRGFRAAAPM